MARPVKSANVISKHLTKAEADAREKAEERLTPDKPPKPPEHLSDSQKKIFKTVCTQLKESKILCSLDNYVLANFAIAVDRLNYIETLINRQPDNLLDKAVMTAKDKYTKDFFRGCNELCLSPQSRAKMALTNVNAAKQAEDPLLLAIKGLNE